MNSSLRLSGIGLRPAHYQAFIEYKPKVAWLEVHSENYFAEGGKSLKMLELLRQDYPISFHGVGLSIGSTDDLNWNYLKQLKELMLRFSPCLVSDHLSFVSIMGQYLHEFIPLPYAEQTLEHVVQRIEQVQNYLSQQILIENISSYIHYSLSTMTECEFITEIANRSGCGILLDINNLYVNAMNLNMDLKKYLSSIPAKAVQEIHLAGFSTSTIDNKEILIDSHDCAVAEEVWDLYRQAIEHLGRKPTIIEWDNDLPSLETLCHEAYRAEQILRETSHATRLTA